MLRLSLLCAVTTAAAAACPGETNQPPTATAQSVATNEDTARYGTLTGTDPEGAALTYALVGSPSLGAVTVSSNGAFVYTPGANAHGSDQFSFKVNDGASDSQPAVVSLTVNPVNDAPTLASAHLGPGPFRTNDTVTVFPSGWSDVEGAAEGYRFQWYVNDVAVSGATTASLSGAFFSRGDAVRCAVTPFDGSASGTPVSSAAVTIQNSPPAMASASLGAGPFRTQDVLTCAGAGLSDPDGDPVALSVEWFRNSLPIAGAVLPTLDGALHFERGDALSCVATPHDGTDEGAPVTSGAVTIENTAPTLTQASLGAGPHRTGGTLTCAASGFADADGDAEGYRYQWLVNGATVAGQNGATLTGPHVTRGNAVRCVATAHDGLTPGTSVSSAPVTLQNAPPTLAQVSIGSGPYSTSSVIPCTPSGFTDPENDAPLYTYAWFKNGAELPGQTASTLNGAGHLASGDRVHCRVTPSDGTDSGAPVASPSRLIDPPPPSFTGASIGPGPYFTNDILTAVATGFSDPENEGYQYQWFRDGVAIPGATAATLDGAVHFSAWQTVFCEVTAYDGVQHGNTLRTNTVTIQNSAPTLAGASLGTGPYFVTSLLPCTPVGAGDPDAGDSLSYTYEWYLNGAPFPAGGPGALSLQQFRKGDTVSCRLRAKDNGGLSSAPVDSAPITLQNSAPVLSRANLHLRAGTTASGSLVATDPDGDPVLGYALVSGSADGTVVLDDASAGTFTFTPRAGFQGSTGFTFTATDGFDTSAPLTARVRVSKGRQLARGEMYGCAIGVDGTLRCWGGNASGQLGDDTRAHATVPVQEALGLTDWASVSAGGIATYDVGRGHTCAIRLDGSLYCWGSNVSGQLGLGTTGGTVARPTRVGAGPWVEVAASLNHTCGIQQDGSLWCWGGNDSGQVGQGVYGGTYASPMRVGTESSWATVGVGEAHTCAIKFNGTLWCFGEGRTSVLGTGSTSGATLPVQESTQSTQWAQVHGNFQRTYALRTDGTLWAWGRLYPTSDFPYQGTPRQLSTGWREVSPGPEHFCGVKTDGALRCAGNDRHGALGRGLGLPSDSSGTSPVDAEKNWVEVSSGRDGSCGRKSTGATWCWGDNLLGQTGTGTDQYNLVPAPVGTVTHWREVVMRNAAPSSRRSGSCATRTDGTLWCAGDGYMGDGTPDLGTKAFTQPLPVVNTWAALGSGHFHTCASRTNGSLWCWGDGANGELGHGVRQGNRSPVQSGSALDWAQGKTDIGAGFRFSCARKTDGGLYCWGDNAYGQLGLGDGQDRSVATRVAGTSTWRSLSVSGLHACGIQADGSLWCWGSNRFGQLGVLPGDSTGNFPERCEGEYASDAGACSKSPLRVGAATDWTKVTAGGAHTCALNAAGTLFCWGRNDTGQLGGGITGPELCTGTQPRDACDPEPVEVGGGFADVWAGQSHTCGRKLTGQLACWGLNTSGQLGDGSLVNRLTPVELDGGSTGWLDVSVGDDVTCAVREGVGGTRPLWCWGRSQTGAFGDDHGWKSTPVRTLLP